MKVMKVELNWNGEDLDISLNKEEATLLKSFVEFFSRERLPEDTVTSVEYDVAEKLYKEISLYIEDDYILDVDKLLSDVLVDIYKTRN